MYPVNHRFPQNFQMISTAGPFWEAATGELEAALKRATVCVFRSERAATFGGHFAQPDTEDKKLRKDPFGGPCFKGTLRIRVAFRMKSRGRDD